MEIRKRKTGKYNRKKKSFAWLNFIQFDSHSQLSVFIFYFPHIRVPLIAAVFLFRFLFLVFCFVIISHFSTLLCLCPFDQPQKHLVNVNKGCENEWVMLQRCWHHRLCLRISHYIKLDGSKCTQSNFSLFRFWAGGIFIKTGQSKSNLKMKAKQKMRFSKCFKSKQEQRTSKHLNFYSFFQLIFISFFLYFPSIPTWIRWEETKNYPLHVHVFTVFC